MEHGGGPPLVPRGDVGHGQVEQSVALGAGTTTWVLAHHLLGVKESEHVTGLGMPLSFVKWDHNRDLMEAADADGRPAVHAQTLAVYPA